MNLLRSFSFYSTLSFYLLPILIQYPEAGLKRNICLINAAAILFAQDFHLPGNSASCTKAVLLKRGLLTLRGLTSDEAINAMVTHSFALLNILHAGLL